MHLSRTFDDSVCTCGWLAELEVRERVTWVIFFAGLVGFPAACRTLDSFPGSLGSGIMVGSAKIERCRYNYGRRGRVMHDGPDR